MPETEREPGKGKNVVLQRPGLKQNGVGPVDLKLKHKSLIAQWDRIILLGYINVTNYVYSFIDVETFLLSWNKFHFPVCVSHCLSPLSPPLYNLLYDAGTLQITFVFLC